jgi:hypothetical protein
MLDTNAATILPAEHPVFDTSTRYGYQSSKGSIHQAHKGTQPTAAWLSLSQLWPPLGTT